MVFGYFDAFEEHLFFDLVILLYFIDYLAVIHY